MKNIPLFDTMLPNIPSYCGSLDYFLDHSKFHLSELRYQGLAHTTNKSLWCELSDDSEACFDFAY